MKNVYIISGNAEVNKASDAICIKQPGNGYTQIPVNMLESIIVLGNAKITTQAIRLCMQCEIPILYATMAGKLLGMCSPYAPGQLERRLRQYSAYCETDTRLHYAKAFVEGKASQQMDHMKLNRKRIRYKDIKTAFRKQADQIGRVSDMEKLLGIEGYLSKLYFEQFGHLLTAMPWEGRNRQPPRDPVNSLLSLSYMFMLGRIACYCRAYGLDPEIGFLHSVQSGRPSLACDILELFRPALDHFVIRLVNRREITESDFEEEGGAILLKKNRFSLFVEKQTALEPLYEQVPKVTESVVTALLKGKVMSFAQNLSLCEL